MTGRGRSLIRRLVLGQAVSIIAAGAVVSLAGTFLLNRATTHFEAKSLSRQAEVLAHGVRRKSGGWTVMAPAPLVSVYESGYSGRSFALVDSAGHELALSRAGADAVAQVAPREREPAFFVRGRWFGVSRPVAGAGLPLWLVVSEDTADPDVVIDDVARTFLLQFAGSIAAMMLLLPLVNAALVRRATREVVDVSARAAAIGPTTLAERLPARDVPQEVAPLVNAVNQALERLEEAFRSQSEFIGNVAHELRTPLALLRLQIDALPADAQGPLRATVMRASHVVDQLLDLASIQGLTLGEDERADLVEIARESVESLAPAVYDSERRVGLSAPPRPVLVRGRPPLIAMTVTNLIDNAIRHTPEGTSIEVVVGEDGSLAVADDGPGIREEIRGLLARRFWRADRARSDSAGIGLSLVERILRVHGGALIVEERPGGGALFKMRFPKS